MTFEQTLSDIYEEQLATNLAALNNEDLSYKDETKSRELGFCLEHVRYLRETDPIFLRSYVKDPFRQNITEKALKWFLEAELHIEVRKLPSSGANALSIAGGGFLNPAHAQANAKTIDFHWECPITHRKAYASHKYTRGFGGSQDAARQEIERFLTDGRIFTNVAANNNVILFAIGDGSHYAGRHQELTDGFGREGRAICTTADGVYALWNRFIQS